MILKNIIQKENLKDYKQFIKGLNGKLRNVDTAYELIEFARKDGILYAIVKQNFVKITTSTDLANVKKFMIANGFSNTRNHNYYHPNLGIILEDLHDENVLTRNSVLYFINTVFHLTDEFWK